MIRRECEWRSGLRTEVLARQHEVKKRKSQMLLMAHLNEDWAVSIKLSNKQTTVSLEKSRFGEVVAMKA